MYKVYTTARQMWEGAREVIAFGGHHMGSRDGACHEVLNWSGTIASANLGWVGGRSRKYAAGELSWYLDGTSLGEHIMHYAPGYKRFLNGFGEADGAYGNRWRVHAQLDFILRELRENPMSRRAVMTCWEAGRDIVNIMNDTKDACCTLSLQFLLRGGQLHCTTVMRSNDLWQGFPYDVFCFTAVQRLIAYELGVEVGTYTHHVGSIHLYDRDKHKELGEWTEEDSKMQVPVTCDFNSFVHAERAIRTGWDQEEIVFGELSGLFAACTDNLLL